MIDVRFEVLDPTGIVTEKHSFSYEPAYKVGRATLIIGDYVYMVTGNGKLVKRLTPPEECQKCKSRIVAHAFSEGKCEICEQKVVTSHIPCDKLCENCSTVYDRCKACGIEMKAEE